MYTKSAFACCATGAVPLATHNVDIDNDDMNSLNVLEHPILGGEGVSTLGAGVDESNIRSCQDLEAEKQEQKPTCNVYHTLALFRISRTLLV